MADDVALPSARSASRLDQRARMRAGVVSLAVGVVLLGAKFVAYAITGSTAVLSDALESIVNVVAATFLIASLRFAGIPADHNHPYGHGKIEFFAAVFEGGLIAFAAVAIVWAAVRRLVLPEPIHEIDEGLALTAGAALVNAVLGVFLLREARRLESTALAADGKHVLSDVWTSAGVVAGLALVRLTGLDWLDPLVALAVGAQLAFT
ncbi:MAG TPA: cation diffusion facilitator family transporter, partial [Planctomycetota bacterium]|nr:cation diffusion facilitator family transporter [Planctomycetota bacterium]